MQNGAKELLFLEMRDREENKCSEHSASVTFRNPRRSDEIRQYERYVLQLHLTEVLDGRNRKDGKGQPVKHNGYSKQVKDDNLIFIPKNHSDSQAK